ncbi:hypothetical protein MY494_03500 [Synechococcus sp. A10-1-5-1]|uniref:hypothetical protein n=1 Tax=Synechococcus sp. A10-1-5-1 TaxID=2936507 RepID=UPI002001C0A2|nr:hypothetical protein [Synechococcus sp. A10-1-5-1]UPM50860.1 hypothetical protein MY494_03500 [Synechococcus sp. A10-1-5-1]
MIQAKTALKAESRFTKGMPRHSGCGTRSRGREEKSARNERLQILEENSREIDHMCHREAREDKERRKGIDSKTRFQAGLSKEIRTGKKEEQSLKGIEQKEEKKKLGVVNAKIRMEERRAAAEEE